MRYVISIVFIPFLLASTYHAAVAQSKKKIVAVLEFNSTNREIGKDELATLTNRFRTMLVKTDAFDVLERQKMRDILKEQNFIMSDNCNSSECAVQIGKLLGVEIMIAGDIGKLGKTYSADLRIIDVTTGKIVQTESQNYKGEVDGLFDVLTTIANSFAGIKTSSSSVNGISNASGAGEIAVDGTFTDPRDGKTYKTVKIGNQVWMGENLNYDAGEGSYCYDDSSTNCNKYGRLYTWEAAKEAVPSGWHLPSKSEFEQLLSTLGGSGNPAYQKLIPGGTSNFNVLFGGWRLYDGNFVSLGYEEGFWSSAEIKTNYAWNLFVYSYPQKASLIDFNETHAFSVRCIKD